MDAISQTTSSSAFSWIEILNCDWNFIKVFVPKGRINNIQALVQIMAWRRSGDKPLSEPMMVRLLTHICVTRPQWVNIMMHTPACLRFHALQWVPHRPCPNPEWTQRHEQWPEWRRHHYTDVTWASWLLNSPLIRMFVHQLAQANHKETSNPRINGPLWKESPITGGFPPQKASDKENVSKSLWCGGQLWSMILYNTLVVLTDEF